MKVSKKIRKRILKENQFSLDVAKVLDIQQVSVRDLAKRNSDKLTIYSLVQFYKEQGYKEEEIFEEE